MSLHPSPSPLLLFETRRLHACLPGEPPRHRSEAIAHRALYPGPLTDEWLARTGWQHVRIGEVPHLIGDRAVELARVIPGIDEPTYPLAESVQAPRIDAVAVRCLLEIIECVLGTDQPAGALRVLVPARGRDGNPLWQRCLPEAVLAPRFRALTTESATAALLALGPAEETLDWVWVVEDTGASIGARWRGEVREDYLDLGRDWLRDMGALQGTEAGGEPAATLEKGIATRTLEVIAHRFVSEVVGRSVSLFREAWRCSSRPRPTLRIVAPPDKQPLIRCVLPRALGRHQLGEVESVHLLDPGAALLELAGQSPVPSVPAPQHSTHRPQAIRPRGHPASS